MTHFLMSRLASPALLWCGFTPSQRAHKPLRQAGTGPTSRLAGQESCRFLCSWLSSLVAAPSGTQAPSLLQRQPCLGGSRGQLPWHCGLPWDCRAWRAGGEVVRGLGDYCSGAGVAGPGNEQRSHVCFWWVHAVTSQGTSRVQRFYLCGC